MLTLPIVDLTNDAPAVQAETIREALGTTGFFEVRNSGLDPGMIERMFDLVSSFFVGMRYSRRANDRHGSDGPKQEMFHGL
jgi:isopenicillin N synthase-like dioxygenase